VIFHQELAEGLALWSRGNHRIYAFV